jgi:phosphoribosylformylglycinamidine (FGAM) synthase PurS component
MAEVTVRLRINQAFNFEVSATTEEEAIDAICDLQIARDKFLNACIENFTIEEAEYDLSEPDSDLSEPDSDSI